MKTSRTALFGAATAALLLPALLVPAAASATPNNDEPSVTVLASGLQGTTGSAIGPDGALYVPQGATGEITRVDLDTGATSTFASGLPTDVVGIGGITDVAFVGDTAYALVTLVGPDVGGSEVNGIYRIDDADSFTVIADLGAWSTMNPPDTPFDQPSGLQFALQPVHGGFLVTDGHHNRVLFVTLDGSVSEVVQFENVVPTGLDVKGRTVYLAEAGPVPYLPEDGRIVSFPWKGHETSTSTVASGYSLMVDVETGRCGSLFALSQGDSPGDVVPGSPALPDSGELLMVHRDGEVSVVVGDLNLPTSLEVVRNTAYVVTLGGDVLKITNLIGHGDCQGTRHGH
ncbi:MAG: ScyD/ScyE family protein [Mycetocola sp.]